MCKPPPLPQSPSQVTFTDGSTVVVAQRERPHLVFGQDGHTVVALSNGFKAQGDAGEYGDRTWTLVQPTLWE